MHTKYSGCEQCTYRHRKRVQTFEITNNSEHTKNKNKESRKVNNVYYILGTVQMHAVYIGYSPRVHTHTHTWSAYAPQIPNHAHTNVPTHSTHTQLHNLKHTHTGTTKHTHGRHMLAKRHPIMHTQIYYIRERCKKKLKKKTNKC